MGPGAVVPRDAYYARFAPRVKQPPVYPAERDSSCLSNQCTFFCAHGPNTLLAARPGPAGPAFIFPRCRRPPGWRKETARRPTQKTTSSRFCKLFPGPPIFLGTKAHFSVHRCPKRHLPYFRELHSPETEPKNCYQENQIKTNTCVFPSP